MRTVILLAVLCQAWSLHAAGYAEFIHGKSTIRVPRPAIQSGAEEMRWRLHSQRVPDAMDVRKETFELIVPQEYTHKKSYGLFIWISPGNQSGIPKDWLPILAQHKLICVSPNNAGNRRSIFDRMRLAIDVNHHLRNAFNIDPLRVHVSGFSGGGRVASMLGVCYADMFPRTIPFMGVNYYQRIPAGKDRVFNPSYIPDDQVLMIAKRTCRFVLVTGEKDFNRLNTKSMYENGFTKDGFRFVRYVEIPKLAHRLPAGDQLDKILTLIDAK